MLYTLCKWFWNVEKFVYRGILNNSEKCVPMVGKDN